eukprot:5928268-Pleurochrysis_carterae.AAC.1
MPMAARAKARTFVLKRKQRRENGLTLTHRTRGGTLLHEAARGDARSCVHLACVLMSLSRVRLRLSFGEASFLSLTFAAANVSFVVAHTRMRTRFTRSLHMEASSSEQASLHDLVSIPHRPIVSLKLFISLFACTALAHAPA